MKAEDILLYIALIGYLVLSLKSLTLSSIVDALTITVLFLMTIRIARNHKQKRNLNDTEKDVENMTNKLKEARIAAGLTQAKMAELFEIPKSTIECWDRGTRTPPAYVTKLIIEKLESMKKDAE